MITFVTCWYELHSKYNKDLYEKWIGNFLLNIKMCNLVIFTNKNSLKTIEKYANNRENIKIILRELEEFHNYKYKEEWTRNHTRNHELNTKTCWEVNMLWNEKTHFVDYVYKNNIFISEWYGWCDIGYFRGRPCDLDVNKIRSWPSNEKINSLDKTKIHYGNVNGNIQRTFQIYKQIMLKGENGLPSVPIPCNEIFIAAGFFLLFKTKISWWNSIHDTTLKKYFDNGYLVKDDQMIVLNNIVDNIKEIKIHVEFTEGLYDNWFMFQRLLL
jgi:hypothetical protein